MSASEKHERKAKPVINESSTDISTSPSGNACICSTENGRNIACVLHGG